VTGPLAVRRSPDGQEVAVHMPFASQTIDSTTDQDGTWVAISAHVDQIDVRIVGLDQISEWTELTP
jgi:hypothetical protein